MMMWWHIIFSASAGFSVGIGSGLLCTNDWNWGLIVLGIGCVQTIMAVVTFKEWQDSLKAAGTGEVPENYGNHYKDEGNKEERIKCDI